MAGVGRSVAWLTALLLASVAAAPASAQDAVANPGRTPFGGFVVNGTEVEGRFVAFAVDNARQSIGSYSVNGREVFRTVTSVATLLGLPLPEGEAGAAIDLGRPGFRIHDNPSGLFVMRGPAPLGDPAAPEEHLPPVGTQFRVELAEGVEASNESRRSLVLVWGEGGRGILRSDRDIRIEGRTLFLQGSATFLAHAPQVLLSDASNIDRAAWQEALAVGLVAAVVTVVDVGERLVVENLAVRDMSVEATRDADGDLVLRLNSTEVVPVVLALNVGRGLVPGDFTLRSFDPSNASIQFPVRRADTLEDVLDATDDGLLLEHRVVRSADGVHMLLSVPVLSPMVLEFAPAPASNSPLRETLDRPVVVAGIVGALLFVGLAVLTFFRRPSDRQMG